MLLIQCWKAACLLSSLKNTKKRTPGRYSFLSQGTYLYQGTRRVWTSNQSVDLEIAYLVERFSSLQRCGTSCTLNNRKTPGAVKWGMEESCQGKERNREFHSSGHWSLDLPKTTVPLKLWPSAALQRIDFWDETMSCVLHFVKMEKTSNTDLYGRWLNYLCLGTVANYFPLSEVGGCQRLHQSSLI